MHGSKMVHIFSDDKFIDSAIRLIDPISADATYYVIRNDDEPFKYVKSGKVKRLKLNTEQDFRAFANHLESIKTEAVFFHALNLPKQRLANLISRSIVKIWLIWGYDLYGNWPIFNSSIYHRQTGKFLESTGRKTSLKSNLLFNETTFGIFSRWRNGKLWLPNKISNLLTQCFVTPFYEAAEKMDIVVPIVPNEYDIVKKLRISAVPAPFQYTCIEYSLNEKIDDSVIAARNILVGNSADPANNHVDVFEKINDYNLGDRLVYVPLSYSGTKEYIDFVIEKGKACFGDNFRPLTGYLAVDEYNKILASCGFVIFNHVRQQGLGNIMTMGYLGAKIFMEPQSPIFSYLKQQGMRLYTTTQLSQSALSENLDKFAYDKNREVLDRIYSESAVKAKIEALLAIVSNEINNKKVK